MRPVRELIVLGKAVNTELGTRGWRMEVHAEAPERCDGSTKGAVEWSL